MLVHLEAIAHRARKHAASGGGADQGEALELHRDRAGAHAVAQDDVDAEVLHRGIDELLDDPRHAVDLVDEEDGALVEVGEEREQVGGLGQRGAARHLNRRAELVGQHGGEGRLAEPRRAIEEDVPERLLQRLRSPDRDRQSFRDLPLPDDLLEEPGPERGVLSPDLIRRRGGDDFLAGHSGAR